MNRKTTQQRISEMDAKITELARVVGNVVQGNKSPFQMVETPPTHSDDTGTVGDICFHSDYMYYCYATDKWLKSIVIKEF